MKNNSIVPKAPATKSSPSSSPSSSEEPAQASSGDSVGGDSQMAQVRELLFGEQVRSTDAHFSQVEARIDGLEEELQSSRREMNQRFDDLVERMEKMATAQAESLQQVSEDLRRQLREEQERAEQEAEELRTDLRKRHEQALRDLGKLQSGKADRRVVSDLMHDLANRLAHDSEESS